MATTIPFTNVPLLGSNPNEREIYRALLSANNNDFGPLNAQGVYFIQIPDGGHLYLSKSRMHCTLLIELLGTATLETWQSCLWDPFNGNNYPSAIVKGLGSGSFKLIAANAKT